MTRTFVATLLMAGLLAGCGAHPMPTAGGALASALQAQSKKKSPKSNPGRIDTRSYQAGIEAGKARAKAPVRQGLTPPGAAAATTPNGMDKLSYECGFAVGELQGALNAYSRIDGSFDVYQWKSFAYMLQSAMTDAQTVLSSDPQLTAKCGVALGILTGGIQSFNSINGSFDVNQWQSFADANRNVLQNALQSLQQALQAPAPAPAAAPQKAS